MGGLDHIEVRGARESNLRDVSVDIPKRAMIDAEGSLTGAHLKQRVA
jgi:excinuclease UvrABC ATPase subunit